MVSKSKRRARTLLIAAVMVPLLAGCRSVLPWSKEPIGRERNLAFALQNNLLFLPTVRVNGLDGRFFLGTAHRRSVVDPAFTTGAAAQIVQLSDKETIRLTADVLALRGVGDAIIGADVWPGSTVTVDYRSGLVTLNKDGMQPHAMTLYRFAAEPRVTLSVNGATVEAIVDTTSPDTIVLPRAGAHGERGTARLVIAGTDFGPLDVRYDNIPTARLGNRVLSRFLVSIDYRKKIVGLWRDPRIPL